MNYIWIIFIVVGYVIAFVNGKTDLVTKELFSSFEGAVKLCIGLTGAVCFWSGMMEIAKEGGMTKVIAKLFSPILSRLFKNIPSGHPAMGAIIMNLTANVLGLGNAATPLGIKAMKELQTLNTEKEIASNDMILFLVLNTCMIQLLPTTVVSLRAASGSADPMRIVPVVWITSAFTCLFGIIFAKIVIHYKEWRNKR